MNIGLLLIRVVVGLLFVGHGTQKLFGWWGGGGLDDTADWFQSLGFRRGRLLALLGGSAETVGGLLLALGFLTPLGCAIIAGDMINAILGAHWRPALWDRNDRAQYPLLVAWEYPLVLVFVVIALAITGAGAISVDAALGWRLDGLTVAVGVPLVALLSSFLSIGARRATHEVAEEEADTRFARSE